MKINTILNPNSVLKIQEKNIYFAKALKPLECDCFTKTQNTQYPEDIFFVRLKHYDNNEIWAKKMAQLTSELSNSISKHENFDIILNKAVLGIGKINGYPYGEKRTSIGNFGITKNFSRGQEYYQKYSKKLLNSENKVFAPNSNEEYKNARTCLIKTNTQENDKDIISVMYGWSPFSKRSNLNLASKAYDKLNSLKNGQIPILRELQQEPLQAFQQILPKHFHLLMQQPQAADGF